MLQARGMRDAAKGRVISFSPKVFIPLTRLCRDFCSYCTYRQDPAQAERLFLSPQQVLETVRRGEKAGCREALLVLGERPEQRYPQALAWLQRQGFSSSAEYLASVCRMVLEESRLLPHSNAGILSRSELALLKPVNASMGLMLESASERLCRPGGPHEKAPSKHPRLRLRLLRMAGELGIPFTTGLLVGIGETRAERIEALQAIRRLHERFGHIQEVIIQNFRTKPGTEMARSPELTHDEMLETIALARIVMGGTMNVQAPPNLAVDRSASSDSPPYPDYAGAGINDLGGISPVTIDFVNPEAPWPHLRQVQERLGELGYRLRARYPVYPEYISSRFLAPSLLRRLRQEADEEGYAPQIGLTHWQGSPV